MHVLTITGLQHSFVYQSKSSYSKNLHFDDPNSQSITFHQMGDVHISVTRKQMQ